MEAPTPKPTFEGLEPALDTGEHDRHILMETRSTRKAAIEGQNLRRLRELSIEQYFSIRGECEKPLHLLIFITCYESLSHGCLLFVKLWGEL